MEVDPDQIILQARARERRNLLKLRRWTKPQEDFFRTCERFALWLAANQVGKSEALSGDIVMTARGESPYRDVRPNGPGPVNIAVISYSDSQIRPLMWKIWQMLDDREVDVKLSCTEGGGLKGYKQPHIRFTSGPGEGSVIYFFTYKQGSEAIAGFTFDAVFADEPLPEAIFGELAPRLMRRQGSFRLTMTTTPDAAPMTWLKAKIEEDRRDADKESRDPFWGFLQTGISEANLTPTRGLVRPPFLTQAQIDESLRDYLPDELPQRRDGAWEGVQSGRWLVNYGDASRTTGRPGGWVQHLIGIDHGVGQGRQCAVLLAYESQRRRWWILDEYRATDRSTIEEDARAILEMLRRNDLQWHQVDGWSGDRAHGGDRYGAGKSNQDLMVAFADDLKLPIGRMRAQGLWIETPRKANGSVRRGLRLMNSMFATGELIVHERCTHFDAAARNWSGALQDPHKDVLDAARYAIERARDTKMLQRVVSEAGPMPNLL